ncbi:MAG: hypothetical protein R3211_11840 [Balneolaceae bacterium]|nr:hypothetical protein [Balneolaceae bacterium]
MAELFLGITAGLFMGAYINNRYREKERWIRTDYLVWAALIFLVLSLVTLDWSAFWGGFQESLQE